MPSLPGDHLSLAIILRLHEGACSLLKLADDLDAQPGEIATCLDRLTTQGIVHLAPHSRGRDERGYRLVPDAYQAVITRGPPRRIAAQQNRDGIRAMVDGLKRSAPFTTLSNATLEKIAQVARRYTYQPAEILFLEGDECRGMYVVETGLVRLFKQNSDAGRELTVRLMGPSDSFNEVPIFDDGPNPVSAEIIEESRLLVLPASAMRQLLLECPELDRAAVTYLASRVRHMLTMVHDLSLRHVRARVAKILLQSIGPDEGVGAGSDQRARLTQREIAEMAGTAREVVARTLKVFEREGAIAVDQGRITILDPAQLESMI